MSYMTRGVIAVFLFVLVFAPAVNVFAAESNYDRYKLSFIARTTSDSEMSDEFECSYGSQESYHDGEYVSDEHDTCRAHYEQDRYAHSVFDQYFNFIYAQFEQSDDAQVSSQTEYEELSDQDEYAFGESTTDIVEEVFESNPAFDRLRNLFN